MAKKKKNKGGKGSPTSIIKAIPDTVQSAAAPGAWVLGGVVTAQAGGEVLELIPAVNRFSAKDVGDVKWRAGLVDLAGGTILNTLATIILLFATNKRTAITAGLTLEIGSVAGAGITAFGTPLDKASAKIVDVGAKVVGMFPAAEGPPAPSNRQLAPMPDNVRIATGRAIAQGDARDDEREYVAAIPDMAY